MKALTSTILGLVVCTATAFAATSPKATTMKMTGTIIDKHCADANKDSLATFVPTHTKDCALIPACAASGYELYTSDGKIMAFDKASNEKVHAFLKNAKSTLKVDVTVEHDGQTLKLISIKDAAPAPAVK
jgi:hypothetical protein